MKIRLIRQRDFAAGLFFLTLGALVAQGATAYNIGNAMRMGPGYFPLLLGIVQALIGLTLVVRNARISQAHDRSRWIEKPCLRSLALIGLAMLVFAFALQSAGLVVATLGLVAISGVAYKSFCWKELGWLSGSLAAFVVIVFAWGLGLPLQVLPA